MKICIEKDSLRCSLYSFLRRCGYAPSYSGYVKTLSRTGYPRFHLYIKETNKTYVFNLHIDQKKPSYGKETAHSGEYEGEIVEKELQRIESITLEGF